MVDELKFTFRDGSTCTNGTPGGGAAPSLSLPDIVVPDALAELLRASSCLEGEVTFADEYVVLPRQLGPAGRGGASAAG